MYKKNSTACSLLLTGFGLLFATTQSPADPHQPLPNYSAFAERGKQMPPNAAALSVQASPLVDATHPLSIENALGVPTFLWASSQTTAKAAHATADISTAALETSARNHLARYAGLYRLDPSALRSAKLHHIHNIGANGVIVRFSQKINGIDVFARHINLLMNRSLALTAISGYLSPQVAATQAAYAQSSFRLTIPQAISAAFNDLHAENLSANRLQLEKQRGVYQWYRLSSPLPDPVKHTLSKPVRAKKVFYPLPDHLEPAYYLELDTVNKNNDTDTADYAYVISATDGMLLSRNTMLASEATPYLYRVWAESGEPAMPYDSPYGNDLTPFPAIPPTTPATPVSSNLVSLSCGPISTCDPWLPPSAVQTVGNNVNAYADITKPSGFNRGDFRAPISSPYVFDHSYDFSLIDGKKEPGQLNAAIVQAFYTTNFLHDWLYDHGFDEQAGNGQDQNYGRGGEEVDRMLVEVNDYSGMNNSDMSTPQDGESATMQLYLWTHSGAEELIVTDPSGTTHKYNASTADFGQQRFRLNSKITPVDDGVDVTSDACQSPFNNAADLAGAIALIDRGACFFIDKVKNAQDAGAIGAIIVNNVEGAMIAMSGSGIRTIDNAIKIPILGIDKADGDNVKQAIATAGQAQLKVSATMLKKLLPPYNSALDNAIVIHEWGHFLSSRLVPGLANSQGRSLGEGWSDFLGLLAMVKEEDRNLENNTQFQAAYPYAQYVSSNQPESYFYGIRRYPYSTDQGKNPLTFRHIMYRAALPQGIPVNPTSPDNSEEHNSGEVWASMLWEAYAALLNDTGRLTFKQAQDRMLDYLVASLKMTPADPTFLEARDALLAVAEARDLADYAAFWRAFAKRGAGVHAVAPARHSNNHAGVVEDFTTP